MWDAAAYLKFGGDRARPFADLMAQVQRETAGFIVDLGCGPGNLTRTLLDHWPAARVLGIDSSPTMLAEARASAYPGRLDFVQVDIADWLPPEPIDLLVSNAALHWIADHESLFPRLAGMLSPGGTLAIQLPDRFQSPSQTAIDETVQTPRWSRLQGIGLHRDSVKPVTWYARCLHALGFAVNAWQTTYVHFLKGANPVLEWVKGTGLRPLLDELDAGEQEAFLGELGARLRLAYPATGDVTLFPMPRLFFVATRSA